MRLSIKGIMVACAVIWGGAILLVGVGHIIWPGYGTAFLEMTASIYPGYHIDAGMTGLFTGTLYGLVDGAVCGAIFAWIYNLFAA